MHGSNVREARTSAKIIFGIQQALALASATVAMFEAIAKANASAPTPQNIPAIASAAIIGGAQIAGIVATTIAGAVADAGLTPDMVKRATRGGYTTVIAQSGEAVVDRDGTREISRMLAIQRTQMETAARWRSGQDRGLGSLRLEVDGRVLGEVVDERRVRSQERGIPAEDARRF
jgi:heterodisulfide reductase subunit A-like polyferredoxin